jgi:hypothetical protein
LAPTLSISSYHSTWNRNKSTTEKGGGKKKKKSQSTRVSEAAEIDVSASAKRRSRDAAQHQKNKRKKKQRKTTTTNKMMIRVALPPLGRAKTWRSYRYMNHPAFTRPSQDIRIPCHLHTMSCKLQDMAFIQVHEPPGHLRISGYHCHVNSKTWRSSRYMNHPAFSGYPNSMSCNCVCVSIVNMWGTWLPHIHKYPSTYPSLLRISMLWLAIRSGGTWLPQVHTHLHTHPYRAMSMLWLAIRSRGTWLPLHTYPSLSRNLNAVIGYQVMRDVAAPTYIPIPISRNLDALIGYHLRRDMVTPHTYPSSLSRNLNALIGYQIRSYKAIINFNLHSISNYHLQLSYWRNWPRNCFVWMKKCHNCSLCGVDGKMS